MTVDIRNIFDKNIELLERIDKSVYYFRKQQHDIALGIIADSMGLIRHFIEAIIDNKEYFNLEATDTVVEMLSSILDAYKKEDYILLADIIELQLISFIISVQELIIGREQVIFNEEIYQENLRLLIDNSLGIERSLIESIDPQTLLQEGYRVEFSSCGLMTLACRNGDCSYYFHTNGRIPMEAFTLASHWYSKEINRYIIYGLGFGYHIKELLSLSDSIEITIYDEDINVILLASAVTRLGDLLKTGRVKLVYDSKLSKLEKAISGLQRDEALYVHHPSFQNIRSDKGRKLLKDYVSWSLDG